LGRGGKSGYGELMCMLLLQREGKAACSRTGCQGHLNRLKGRKTPASGLHE